MGIRLKQNPLFELISFWTWMKHFFFILLVFHIQDIEKNSKFEFFESFDMVRLYISNWWEYHYTSPIWLLDKFLVKKRTALVFHSQLVPVYSLFKFTFVPAQKCCEKVSEQTICSFMLDYSYCSTNEPDRKFVSIAKINCLKKRPSNRNNHKLMTDDLNMCC